MYLPPEWPPEVRQPSVPDWETSAVAWLLDAVPPDYRAYEILKRYPTALARMALHHVIPRKIAVLPHLALWRLQTSCCMEVDVRASA
ncbi:hypothetical protein EJK15_61785 [Nonomuraea basaltis]|nr:hypothetical protein EJK15_61785 [Nonomuraea basaltis]